MHSQYSSSVSPFQAKTGTPAGAFTVPVGPTATAAAAWSCVEKMLQEAQRTWAPSATSVSMSTPVWMVMWSEPVMRCPLSGFLLPYSLRMAIRPGISFSASSSSLRPQSARVMSLTRYSSLAGFLCGGHAVFSLVRVRLRSSGGARRAAGRWR